MKRHFLFALLCFAGILSLAACLPGLPEFAVPTLASTPDPNRVATSVEKTVSIRQTIAALETQIARGTSLVVVETPQTTRISPTVRPPTATATPAPTVILPTQPVAPTAAPTSSVSCNAATFISDVTFPDKSVLSAEQSFTKVWRLKNSGTCAWNPSYTLVFVSGAQMGAPNEVALPASIKPGETVDLTVNLIAPKDSGEYTGLWQLRAPDSQTFSTSPKNEPFWVKIIVGTTTMSGTSFVDAFCTAVWKNGTGASLGCPASRSNFTTGSLMRVDAPVLAGGTTDNEPALVTIPADGSDGKIIGRYPAFKVLAGDHFVALLGCMNASPKCSVTFKLSYTLDGSTVVDLGSWDRIYDQNWVKVNLDLSSLADKSVQFIFTVGNKDGASVDDTAFWLSPYIKR